MNELLIGLRAWLASEMDCQGTSFIVGLLGFDALQKPNTSLATYLKDTLLPGFKRSGLPALTANDKCLFSSENIVRA